MALTWRCWSYLFGVGEGLDLVLARALMVIVGLAADLFLRLLRCQGPA